MWRKLFILMWLYYSSKDVAWGHDKINRITSLKYRLNACSMPISSEYGFQTGWIICVMACTTIMYLKTVCFSAPPLCWVVTPVKPGSEHLSELLFSLSSCKRSHYREAVFSLACVRVLYYSGQALQNGFCPLKATSVCQSSGGHTMLTAKLILKAA